MTEQKKLPRMHIKLTNKEDFIQLMKGEYLSLDDNHLRIAIWYDLYDFKNKVYSDSVKELLNTKELFLVCKKTKDFCTTYTMYKKFFKIDLVVVVAIFVVYVLSRRRSNLTSSHPVFV